MEGTAGGYQDDVLQPLAIDQIEEYRKVSERHLPESIRAHHFLFVQIRWRKHLNQPQRCELPPRCLFTVYVPRHGNIDKCTFIAICAESDTGESKQITTVYDFLKHKHKRELRICFDL